MPRWVHRLSMATVAWSPIFVPHYVWYHRSRSGASHVNALAGAPCTPRHGLPNERTNQMTCHATLAGMLSPILIWTKVRQVREPRQKCLLAPLRRCHDTFEYKKNGRFPE
jgi:hypothetical protein